MGKVIILDEITANQIAAGEVIERPASVVKELVENSIDAGATAIAVEIKNGGISYIRISDNGSGIEYDDMELVFERHGTSKIRTINELDSLNTLGFRGEALASVASVAKVELVTRIKSSDTGMSLTIEGGKAGAIETVGAALGTTFIIRNLFYNTPARYKFLKKDVTEAGYVSNILTRMALAHPDISFKLINNGSTIIHTPGNNDLKSVIYSIYGGQIAKNILSLDYTEGAVNITGFVGKPEIARGNRNHQSIFMNKRYIKSSVITAAIEEAYRTILMKNKFPFVIIDISLNPALVDVNVHPAKTEVRFSDEQFVFRSIYHAVKNAMMGSSLIPSIQEKESFIYEEKHNEKKEYEQKKFEQAFKTPLERTTDNRFKYVNKNVDKVDKSEEKNVRADHNYSVAVTDDRVMTDKKQAELINVTLKRESLIYGNEKEVILIKESENELKDNVVSTINSITNNELDEGFSKKASVEEIDINEISIKKEVDVNEEIIISEDSHKFLQGSIVGQLFNTYIIIQYNDELFYIDQHAAHERIIYERLKNKPKNKQNFSQNLLVPLIIELTNQEYSFVMSKIDFFNEIGFVIEEFGNNSILIRSVPDGFNGTNQNEFKELIDRVAVASSTTGRLENEMLYQIACKAAIKAGQKLTDIEIRGLLEQLVKTVDMYTCPHGRPIIVSMTKKELEKRFKRIV